LRETEEFVQMFLDEARITALLSHPNIARVFDLGQENGELLMAMEFVPGQSLASIVRACRKANRPVPLGFAGKVVRDACLALQHAHEFKVIHRDMSPSNVMVT